MHDDDVPLPSIDLRGLNQTVKAVRAHLAAVRDLAEEGGPLGWPTLGYASFDDFIDHHGHGLRQFWEMTRD